MGLDAFVYCDCFEKGRLLESPPPGFATHVGPDGSLDPGRTDYTIEEILVWDAWQARSCKHPRGILLHHRLGNFSLIGLLRLELQREASRFPILLGKVVYNGTHGGDYIPLELVPKLQTELEALDTLKCNEKEKDGYVSQFRKQMMELAGASLSVGKPIVF